MVGTSGALHEEVSDALVQMARHVLGHINAEDEVELRQRSVALGGLATNRDMGVTRDEGFNGGSSKVKAAGLTPARGEASAPAAQCSPSGVDHVRHELHQPAAPAAGPSERVASICPLALPLQIDQWPHERLGLDSDGG